MTDDYIGLKPGQERAITRLEESVDTVFVTNYASAAAGMQADSVCVCAH